MKLNDGFSILYSDCPWEYDNPQDHDPARGGTPYESMSVEDLCAMAPLIDRVAAKDSLLFSWATYPKLQEALQVMKAWGYQFSTVAFTWIKLNSTGRIITLDKNMVVMNTPNANDGFTLKPKDIVLKGGVRSGQGYYTNANAEIVLVGKRGKTGNIRASKSVKQVVFAPIGELHSAKPEEVRRRIDEFTGNIPGLELFARPPARVTNWVKIGWEIDNEDIRVMLQRLIDGEYRRPEDGTV